MSFLLFSFFRQFSSIFPMSYIIHGNIFLNIIYGRHSVERVYKCQYNIDICFYIDKQTPNICECVMSGCCGQTMCTVLIIVVAVRLLTVCSFLLHFFADVVAVVIVVVVFNSFCSPICSNVRFHVVFVSHFLALCFPHLLFTWNIFKRPK